MEVFSYNNWVGVLFFCFFLASHAGITNCTGAPNVKSMVFFSSRKLHKLFVGPYNLVILRKTRTHTHKWGGGGVRGAS